MAYVKVKLTEKEAAMLYVAASSMAEELTGDPERMTKRDAAPFWRALDKLQAARQKYEDSKTA